MTPPYLLKMIPIYHIYWYWWVYVLLIPLMFEMNYLGRLEKMEFFLWFMNHVCINVCKLCFVLRVFKCGLQKLLSWVNVQQLHISVSKI